MRWFYHVLLALGVLLLSIPSTSFGRTSRRWVGQEIPQRICLPAGGIVSGSDSMLLNSRYLVRGVDYAYDRAARCFTLTSLVSGDTDTLRVSFVELPLWLQQSFGREIPEPQAPGHAPPAPLSLGTMKARDAEGDVRISGFKSFRVTSGTAGQTDFGQTLDLKVQGQLSPGVTLTGSVSDRGYNPSYGSLNSRLNELDKLYLRLDSRRLNAQIGDLSIPTTAIGTSKRISGASAELRYPRWQAHGTAARPQGRYATATLRGADGYQGPYQLTGGAAATPVVPGSDQVWLDGALLERGAEKDYTIDYPSGQVTFNVNHPIDRRSRIEVDYEPLASVWKQEYLVLGGGAATADSSVFGSTELVREGDDDGERLTGELTETDREVLAEAGDSDLFRSGVVADTTGDYAVIADSLPDSVFQYVGARLGTHRVTFSYVGVAKGSYRFLGAGRYQYVGAGSGDYVPLVRLVRPERTDYYQALLGVRRPWLGELRAEVRQSRYDRNLLSTFGDSDNDALYYRLSSRRRWYWNEAENSLAIATMARERGFRQRDRLGQPDLARMFLQPESFVAATREQRHDIELRLAPANGLTLNPKAAILDYQGEFRSSLGTLGASWAPYRAVLLSGGWQGIDAKRLGDTSGTGRASTIMASVKVTPRGKMQLEMGGEFDTRRNDYRSVWRGTRYYQGYAAAAVGGESARYERYVEDTLVGFWEQRATRDRLTVGSARTLGLTSYTAQATAQRISDSTGERTSFLGRAGASYQNPRRNLSVVSAWTVSDELRNSRGIAYLEVEPGRGNFSLEEGRYVPDPKGNYVQVEELLSDKSGVRRGQKNFQFSKRWSGAELRFTSDIQEELLEAGDRTLLWILPFYSDPDQPYQYYLRRYDGDIRLLRWRDIHAITLAFSEERESRSVAGAAYHKKDQKGTLTLRQVSGRLYVAEAIDLFRSDRDSYFAGSGDIDGYKISTSVRGPVPGGDLAIGSSYRRAEAATGERSGIAAVTVTHQWRKIRRGEFRATVELYQQELDGVIGTPSYQLTDSHYGRRGALWTLLFTYGAREGLRINSSISGRHSDDRAARITARGELVAGF